MAEEDEEAVVVVAVVLISENTNKNLHARLDLLLCCRTFAEHLWRRSKVSKLSFLTSLCRYSS